MSVGVPAPSNETTSRGPVAARLSSVARRTSRAGRRTSRARRPRHALLELSQALPFLLPKAVVFGLFVLVPFGYTILLTFQEGSLLGGLTFAGMENYRSVVSDGLFRQTLVNTAVFMLICVPLTLVVTLLV